MQHISSCTKVWQGKDQNPQAKLLMAPEERQQQGHASELPVARLSLQVSHWSGIHVLVSQYCTATIQRRTGLWNHDMKISSGKISPARTCPSGTDKHVSKRSKKANRCRTFLQDCRNAFHARLSIASVCKYNRLGLTSRSPLHDACLQACPGALSGYACRLAQKRYRERQKEKTLALARQVEDLIATAERLGVDIAVLKRQNATLESKLRRCTMSNIDKWA